MERIVHELRREIRPPKSRRLMFIHPGTDKALSMYTIANQQSHRGALH